MFSKSLLLATATLSLISSTTAIYGAGKKINVALYWGQGYEQQPLADFCVNSAVDIIPIGFVNAWPPAGNGYVGADFGNACWGLGYRYQGPGYNGDRRFPNNDLLPNYCSSIQSGIPICQAKGKKILLSVGGHPPAKSYKTQMKSVQDGEFMANFLWKAYGPKDPTWTGPRPFDRGGDNKTESIVVEVDGFDFDIETTIDGTNTSLGETQGYVAMIKKLRVLMAAQTAKTGKVYIISGSPQCPLINGKESNMDAMIQQGGFDILFIQFYNQGVVSCTARSRAANNGGVFNYAAWLAYVRQAGGASNKARLYIGLLGGPTGGTSGDYINVAEVKNLIKAYGLADQFGGIMLWEAQATMINNDAAIPNGQRYWHVVKFAMMELYPGVPMKREIDGLHAEILAERNVVPVLDAPVQHKHRSHMARHQHH